MIPENEVNEEAKNELNKIKEIEKVAYGGNLYYETDKYSFDFQNFQRIIKQLFQKVSLQVFLKISENL